MFAITSKFLRTHGFKHHFRDFSISLPKKVAPAVTKVGWIGTGVMGKEMCKHIIKAGYQVSIFSRTKEKTKELVDLGAKSCSSPREVAKDVDVVFSMVGFPEDVKEVLISEDRGILGAIKTGGIIVDMTTSEPRLAMEIAKYAAEKNCYAIDCPVTGGDMGAKAGTLSIMAGGDSQVVQHMKPLLSTMGSVFYLGEAGSGQACKAANQITIATSMLGLCEGLTYAHKAGLNLEDYINAIRNGGAGSKSLELYASRILSNDYKPGFYVKHFVKDLGIALRECERMKISLPGLALAHQLYISLEACGDGDDGTQALIKALERINGLNISEN